MSSCPCCGFASLSERGACEICPVCEWQDASADADVERGGPNASSLAAARQRFSQGGPLTTEPPADDARFPLLRLGGTPREIGLAHGSLCASRIARCWALYARVFGAVGIAEEEMPTIAARFATAIGAYAPPLLEEIEAVAEGAGLPAWQVVLLNSRSEVINLKKGQQQQQQQQQHAADAAHNECTTLHITTAGAGGGVLGENWDWTGELEPLCVVLRIAPATAAAGAAPPPPMLFMTEPGIVGKIGLNAAGVGVCLNMLQCGGRRVGGVPLHVLLRAALECRTAAEARAALARAERGTSSSITVADSSTGTAQVLELAGEVMGCSNDGARVAEGWLARTNHYLGLGLGPPPPDEVPTAANASSFARMARVRELVAERAAAAASAGEPGAPDAPAAVDAMKALLADHKHATLPIRRPYLERHPSLGLEGVGTICTLVMDLGRRELHITRGSPIHNAFEKMTFASLA